MSDVRKGKLGAEVLFVRDGRRLEHVREATATVLPQTATDRPSMPS
jgi:hypothetical protein